MWFYVDQGTRRGPHSLEELIAAILTMPDPGQALVWREGLANWQPAATVPELAAKMPPPPPPVQAASGIGSGPLFGSSVALPSSPAEVEEAALVATLYRRLVLLVGVQMLVGVVMQVVAAGADTSAGAAGITLILFVGALGLSIGMAVTVYRLMHVLGGEPVLWALGIFVPCANILVLLIISSKAQAWCKRRGIEVGFLGPTPESIARLRDGS